MSWQKVMEYGVIKVDGPRVYLYETSIQKEIINAGNPVSDARWAGNAVIVTFTNGKIRRYTSFIQYTIVG
jgi:hypothetical protein